MEASEPRRAHGPFGKLWKLIHWLGWTVREVSVLEVFPGCRLDLSLLDVRIARKLLEFFWKRQMTTAVRHRWDFADLIGIDSEVSFKKLRNFDVATTELLHCVQDGTHFLNTVKTKFDPSVTPLCSCGQDFDTVEHRALHCRRYVGIRVRHLDVTQMWHVLPRCMTHHGLAPENPGVESLWTTQCQLDRTFDDWQCFPVDHQVTQHLFTDGSCDNPRLPLFALGGWSVVSATEGTVLGVGLTPGIMPNSNRSEVWALVMAFDWLLRSQCVSAVLYVDSQYAVDGGQYLLQFKQVPSDWSDRDFWDELLQRVILFNGVVSIEKIAAHRTPQDENTAKDRGDLPRFIQQRLIGPELRLGNSTGWNDVNHCFWPLRSKMFLFEMTPCLSHCSKMNSFLMMTICSQTCNCGKRLFLCSSVRCSYSNRPFAVLV